MHDETGLGHTGATGNRHTLDNQGLLRSTVVSLALAQAGKLKLLAVASSDRLPALPNVPTMAETMPGFEAVAWYGIVAPPKTPKDIVDKINADVNEALRQPEVQDHLTLSRHAYTPFMAYCAGSGRRSPG